MPICRLDPSIKMMNMAAYTATLISTSSRPISGALSADIGHIDGTGDAARFDTYRTAPELV